MVSLQSADYSSANSNQQDQTLREHIEKDPQLLDRLLFSNEAHFHLSEHVNK